MWVRADQLEPGDPIIKGARTLNVETAELRGETVRITTTTGERWTVPAWQPIDVD